MTVPEALLLAVTTLVLVVVPSFVTAGSTKQLQGCNDVDQPSIAKSDAAYPDAMDLAQTLISHSFIVTLCQSVANDRYVRRAGRSCCLQNKRG
jgi:hypothetical protein